MNVIEDFFKNRISFTLLTVRNIPEEKEYIYRSTNTFEANTYNVDLHEKLMPFFWYVTSDFKKKSWYV